VESMYVQFEQQISGQGSAENEMLKEQYAHSMTARNNFIL